MAQNILCIDFLNILYRGFYALPHMRNSKQENVGAFFSFIKIIKKLITTYSINKIIICNDSPSFKKISHDFYKQNREKTPEDLLLQKEILLRYLEKINIPVIAIDGYEADDIIYSLAHYFSKKDDVKMYIASGDKDLHGLLLLNNIFIIDHNKNLLLDKAWLYTKYIDSVTQEKLHLYYALCGDQSDNITGVPGVGEKTAIKIITEYNTLDHLYDNVLSKEVVSSRIKKLLLNHKEDAYKSLFLITPLIISDDALLPYLGQEGWDEDNFLLGNDILIQYECHSLLYNKRNMLGSVDQEKATEKAHVEVSYPYAKDTFTTKIVLTAEDIGLLIEAIKESTVIGLDTETSSGNPLTTTVLGFSLCVREDAAWYIPLYVNSAKVELYDDCVAILHYITDDKICVLHNALFDLHALSTLKIILPCPIFDTMITAYIFKEFKIGLKDLSLKIMNQRMQSFSEVMEFGVYKTFDEVPLEKGSSYAAADARQTFLLYNHYQKLLKTDQYSSYNDLLSLVEMPVIKVLRHIESNGIYCDNNVLIAEEKKYVKKLEEIKEKIREIASAHNSSFNPMSNQQTRTFLYDILKLPHNKNKKTDQATLITIETLHPLVNLILLYRSLQSNISHFTTGLLRYIKEDGKIYTHYQQFVTHTGRITTINPNLQNIPRSDHMYAIRNAFHAQKGNLLMSFDYSQIELRVLTHFSKDAVLLDLFKNNKDIHLLTATSIFNKSPEEITSSERQIAKKINFSIIYGQSAYNLAKDLRITLKDAKNYLDLFKKTYPLVFTWMEQVIHKAKINGFVSTLYGMKRVIPEIQDNNKNVFKSGCRMAINTIIQGTAAEVMKKAMINVLDYIEKNNLPCKIVLQIHDELLIEMPKDNSDRYSSAIQTVMENEINLSVDLKVNITKNTYWQ